MTIRNKQTGEMRQVTPQQAQQMGISAPTSDPTSVSAAPQQDRGLANAGSLVGGLLGGNAGRAVGGTPGAMGGAAAGAGAGFAMGDVTQSLLNTFKPHTATPMTSDQTKQQAKKDLTDQAGSMLTSALGELIGTGTGKVLQKLTGSGGRALVKAGIPEASSQASDAFAKQALGKGEELSTGIVRRGITGSGKKLVQLANAGKTKISSLIDTLIGKMNQQTGDAAVHPASTFITNALTTVQKNLLTKGRGATISLQQGIAKELADIASAQTPRAGQVGWKAPVDLLSVANDMGRGQASTDMTTSGKMVWTELAKVLQQGIKKEAPDLATALTDYGFYNRLGEAAANRGSKALNLSGGIFNFLNKAIFNPAVVTHGAQVLNTVGNAAPPVLGSTSQTAAQLIRSFLTR